MQTAQLHQIQPSQVNNPLVRLWRNHVQIQGGATCRTGVTLQDLPPLKLFFFVSSIFMYIFNFSFIFNKISAFKHRYEYINSRITITIIITHTYIFKLINDKHATTNDKNISLNVFNKE